MKKMLALLCAFALLLVGAAQAEGAYLAAYREALENLYNNQMFPDGSSDEYANVEGNGFAIYDVDGDGRAELIIQWNDTATASWCGLVYDYDEAAQSLRAEYEGGAYLQFFDNGMIEDPLSHNQGPTEDFWPYSLAQYDPEQDAYVSRGSVDAIERDYLEANREAFSGVEFPEDADADGNGVVYCIDGGDWMDGDAYRQWRASFAGDGNELRIPYVNLTMENIQDVQ